MKLLKWLTHPVYLLLGIIAVAVYLNGDVLFPDGATAVAPESTAEPATVARRLDPTGSVDGQPASPSAPMPPNGAPSQDEGAAAPAVEAPERLAGEAPQAPGVESAPVDEMAASADRPVDAEAEWKQARLLAWHGEWDAAVDAYRRLAEQQPDNMDAHGELGNVLMRAGRWDAAADAYAGAALAAGRAGNEELAWYLHSIIAGLDYEKAAALRRQLTAGRNPDSASGA